MSDEVLKDEASQRVIIRPDVLEALKSSVSTSSKLFDLMFLEKNGKAWAMIKAKTKTRAVNKKRRLYEITGEENELRQTDKRRRLDET